MVSKFTFATSRDGIDGSFDEHIENSIRGYGDLWNDILKISEYYVEDDINVYDIGCSTGKLLRAMQVQHAPYAPRCNYIGIEIESDFFQDAAGEGATTGTSGHKKTQALINSQYLTFIEEDVKNTAFTNANLVTSVFSLQFMSQRDRLDTIRAIYKGLNPGGAFIFAEKTVSASSRIQAIRTFTYYDYKRQTFSYEDIMTKEQELRHMMKPNTHGELIEMVTEAGFKEVDSFWQNHGFTGYIALK